MGEKERSSSLKLREGSNERERERDGLKEKRIIKEYQKQVASCQFF